MLFWLALSIASHDAEGREAKVVREFKREVPCPVTLKRRGACPGYQADHIIPLCAGGADHWANMQWLTLQAHRGKTRVDVRACAALRRQRKADR